MVGPEELGPNGQEFHAEREWYFSDLQGRVNRIYREHDEECEYGPDTMFVKLLGNALHLKRAVKLDPENNERLDRALTNIVIWTTTIANYGNIDLLTAVGEKYWGGCPRCKQMPCLASHEEKCQDLGLSWGNIPGNLPVGIDQWQKHFARMYPNNFHGRDLDDVKTFIADKLIEEGIELFISTDPGLNRDLTDLSHHDQKDDGIEPWKGEIADILAWSFAMAEALKRTNDNYSLEKSLREQYDDGCAYCKQSKCQCPQEKTILEQLHKWQPM